MSSYSDERTDIMMQGADFQELRALSYRGGDGFTPSSDGGPIRAIDDITEEDVIGYDALWDSMIKCKRGVL